MPVIDIRKVLIYYNRHFFVLIILIILIFNFQFGIAQPHSLTDSVKTAFESKPEFVGGFNSRGSFIEGSPATVFSIGGGISFSKRLSFGLNYHWLKEKSKFDILYIIDGLEMKKNLKMRYVSLSASYTFYQKNKWLVSIPINIGIGKSFYQDAEKNKHLNNLIVLYEPVMLVEYKLLKYFGVAGGIGFRLMLKNNKQINKSFSSPIYVARIRIYYSKIYADLFK